MTLGGILKSEKNVPPSTDIMVERTGPLSSKLSLLMALGTGCQSTEDSAIGDWQLAPLPAVKQTACYKLAAWWSPSRFFSSISGIALHLVSFSILSSCFSFPLDRLVGRLSILRLPLRTITVSVDNRNTWTSHLILLTANQGARWQCHRRRFCKRLY